MNFPAYPKNRTCKTRYCLNLAHLDEELRAAELAQTTEHHLHSTFALDQLTHMASTCEPARFILTLAPIFGFDIPAHTYFKLYQALLNGEVKNPEYRIEATENYPADYDNLDRTIRVHPAALAQILEKPHTSWKLLAILLHEFGHHLDNVLRQDLADKHPDESSTVASDSRLEEGTVYVQLIALFEPPHRNKNGVEIATYTAPDAAPVAINACYFLALKMIRQAQGTDAQHSQTSDNDREGFESGSGDERKSTHETIEKALGPLGFDALELDAIYFGNWLRDYSQLLDPKIVRAASMPKDFPDVLSRQTLTAIVDVLAAAKFTIARSTLAGAFKATPKNLGVYRPSQHIDNPKAVNPKPADPTSRDVDFEPWVLPGDAALEIDPESSMKNYIQRSVAVMQDELTSAMSMERGVARLNVFGAALHILEDLFAHSNFVELSLIKAGHENVLPWTSRADCKHGLPLVTGTFGGTDVIASLAAPLGELLYSVKDVGFKPTESGSRSERDQIMLLLLNEHPNENLLKIFETFLSARDKWAELPISDYVEMYAWFTGELASPLSNAYNTMMQGLLRLIGNSIGDHQTLRGDDPNTSGSTDPSHSQLSKDHAEHPLHMLAASLATDAVTQVGQAMIDYWNGKPDADPVATATAYFVHPMDSAWQDARVREWAQANPLLVELSTSKSDLDKIHEQLDEVAHLALKGLERDAKEVRDFIFGGEKNKNSLFHVLSQLTSAGGLINAVKPYAGNKN